MKRERGSLMILHFMTVCARVCAIVRFNGPEMMPLLILNPLCSVRVAVLDPIAMTTVVGITAALLLLLVVAAFATAFWYRGRRYRSNGSGGSGCFKKGLTDERRRMNVNSKNSLP